MTAAKHTTNHHHPTAEMHMLDKTSTNLTTLRTELVLAWQAEVAACEADASEETIEAATDLSGSICSQIAEVPAAHENDLIAKIAAFACIVGEPREEDSEITEDVLLRSIFADLRALGIAPANATA